MPADAIRNTMPVTTDWLPYLDTEKTSWMIAKARITVLPKSPNRALVPPTLLL